MTRQEFEKSILRHAEITLQNSLDRTKFQAENIISDMQRLIMHIEEDGKNISINNCGELQGVNMLESLVGQVYANKEALSMVKYIIDFKEVE